MPASKRMKIGIVAGLVAAGLLVAAGAAAWVGRRPLLTWYDMNGLEKAGDADRALWTDRVAGLGEDAEPAVFACLKRADDAACRNAGAVLERWAVQRRGDGRAAALAGRMTQVFGDCSAAGRNAILTAAAAWFRPDSPKPTDALVSSCARLISQAAEAPDAAAHESALSLSAAALDVVKDSRELPLAARALVRKSLHDDSAATRQRAVQLAVRPDIDAADAAAELLHDPAPEVRRAAVLAVGPEDEKTLPAKSLLPALHDADPAVRKACEEVLRKDRRLSPLCFKIGWCLCHPDPGQRLNVLDYLQRGAEVEPGVWLRELSHDDSPAVRLAAARVMSQQDVVDLSDRLEQMADGDPSPTVCQIARLYEKWSKAEHDGLR